MKVAFDHQIFSCQQYGGISRYFRMLADGLYGLDGVEPHVVAPQYVADAVAGLPTGVRTRCGCGPSSFDSVSDR
ncbi:hypothetical protein, partial [Salidesulfovibrio brasiliensis]|uniref:hypothetical protein n=1 Tax=Salidesulfovibrio brasiliensis TaxID=221711 RepID=UPI0006D14930